MTFNTALTGLRAATNELNITGNNIANSSTTGFKQSRAEFADVYASSVIGGGANAIGNGVRVADISQQFSQGNISFTENALDMAINGSGFFVINNQGSQQFTRAGLFGVDDEGYISANDGSRLQGFPANATGVVSGVLGDLQISTASIEPRQTTLVDVEFNLSADEEVLAERGNTTTANGADIGVVQVGPAGVNGYTAGTIDVDGVTYNIPSAANQPANIIAGELSAIQGVAASAITTADITFAGTSFPLLTGDLTLNGRSITGNNITEVAQAINSLAGFTATEAGGVVTVTSTNGENLLFDVSSAAVQVPAFTMTVDGAAITQGTANEIASVGGEIFVTLDEGVVLDNGTSGVFTGAPPLIPFVNNQFDPGDQNTYNSATSVTIFDSLGAPHVLTQFFVKESSSLNPPNTWSMYIQIDGENVGNPDPLSTDPSPTLAQFTLRFNPDGSLDAANTDEILITNWTPLDADGNPAGALQPNTGGTTPLPDPPTSSNFLLEIDGSTQFSGNFSVNNLDQNGFASGQLAGVDISDTGVIFARYSNGEALVLGQVALADFANEQGLTPLGNTSWAQSFESGEPVIGAPRTASLGAITAGALEDSNVELAEELVSLIIAQRNFQANSRTIETANEITQTIINLR